MADKKETKTSAHDLDDRVRQFEQLVVESIDVKDTQSGRKEKKREWITEFKFIAAWFGLWLLVVAAAMLARNAWPPDETRLIGMAWEMWSQKRFSVPILNGEAQPHPPLFLWLVHLGWQGFGVVEWWARLIGPLAALACLFVTQRLARLLWPQELEVARYAPLLLLGSFVFALAASAALPETLTTLFTLISFWALLLYWRRRDMRAWLLLGAALALGVLNAGFIVMLYVAPVALLAPLWARVPRPQWKYWYVDVTKALLMAAAIFSVWLAAVAGSQGAPYVARLLSHIWRGTPLAMFAQAHPWWWYVWVAPVIFLPWSILPLTWMRLWYIRREPLEDSFVFCLLWIVAPLVALSLLPTKQPQYLLPLLPAGVLLSSRLLFARELVNVYQEKPFGGMAIPLLMLGGVQMALPRLPRVDFLPEILWQQSPWMGVAIMAVGIALAWLPFKNVRRRVFDIAAVCVMLMVFVLLGVASQFNSLYPLHDTAQVIAQAQADERPVAHIGPYEGEYHFAGRLRKPLAVIDASHVNAWATEHPDGVLVSYTGVWSPHVKPNASFLYDAPFRDNRVQVFGVLQLKSPSASTN